MGGKLHNAASILRKRSVLVRRQRLGLTAFVESMREAAISRWTKTNSEEPDHELSSEKVSGHEKGFQRV